jgi:hydroxymethylpyrimidine/phosphomethylpyrimidine kinase
MPRLSIRAFVFALSAPLRENIDTRMKTYPTVLSIAGSDSIGGAGIQADVKTCCAHGVYAMTVVTAITAQSTRGVDSVEPCSPGMLRSQLWTALSDVRPDAVKIGMVPGGEAALIIAEAIDHFGLTNVVIDPVMASTSGATLSGGSYTDVLRSHLAPLSTLITPNIPEAVSLSGKPIDGVGDMRCRAAEMCRDLSTAVLLKGGHLTATNRLTDVLATPDGTVSEIHHPLINTTNTHGTGCSLSSAIAARLACGCTLTDAVLRAGEWLHRAIEAGAGYTMGHGHGPINHLFNITRDNEDNSKQ